MLDNESGAFELSLPYKKKNLPKQKVNFLKIILITIFTILFISGIPLINL